MAERRLKHKHIELTCRKCGEEFQTRKELFQHLESEHFRNKEYRCQDCSYKSSRSSNLNRHRLLVHEELPSPSPIRINVPVPPTTACIKPVSPAISLACSPSFENETLPPPPAPRLSGKPLAMLRQSYGRDEDVSSEAPSDPEEETMGNQPEEPPKVPVALTAVTEVPSTQLSTPATSSDTILVTVVEKTVTRYYSEGLVIRQTDVTNTFTASVPSSWNKNVVCHYGMKKD